MLTFLRGGTRGQRITVLVVVLLAIAASCVALFGRQAHSRRTEEPTVSRQAGTSGVAAPPATASPSLPVPSGAQFAGTLPTTASADVYAAAVADALWNIDYAATSRDAVVAFWRAQLSPVLPAGVPRGTTLAQARAAAMSTLAKLLPSPGMWPTLARDRTASAFTVTGLSEPASWIEAVNNGQITDPGLTAREVLGVQKISYGAGGNRHTTAQSQQLLVVLLCPPTTAACRVEVFPPRETPGASG